MLIPFFVGFLAVFFAYQAQDKRSERYLLLSFLIITSFAAIRYDYGPDYLPYLESYEIINSYGGSLFDFNYIESVTNKGEFGWTYINVLCRSIGYFGLIIIMAIFHNAVIYLLVKKHVSPQWWWFSVFIYFFCSRYFFTGSCSTYRQWTAVCIFVIASQFIANKKPIPYFVLILAASFIHRSALILFPVYFVSYIRVRQVSLRNMAVVLVGLIVANIVFPRILSSNLNALFAGDALEEYALYVGSGNIKSSNSNILGMISLYVKDYVFPLMGFYYLRKDDNVYLKVITMLALLSLFVLPFASVIPMANRFAMYFYIFNLAVCPMAISRMLKDKQYSGMASILLLIFVLFAMKEFYSFFDSRMGEYFRTYQTIFSVPWK